jgi:hypothetical protein
MPYAKNKPKPGFGLKTKLGIENIERVLGFGLKGVKGEK